MIPDNKKDIENRIIQLGRLVNEGTPLAKERAREEALKIINEFAKLIKSKKGLSKP